MSISLKCTFAVFQKRAKVIIFAHRCKTGTRIGLAAKAVVHSLSEGLGLRHSLSEGLGLRHSLSEGLCSQTGSLRSRRLLRIPSPPAAGRCKAKGNPRSSELDADFLLLCGEGGIRTPGTLPFNSFQDCRNRPLYHLSNIFVIPVRVELTTPALKVLCSAN